MIGDNLDSDIMLGKNANIDSLLVMTGVTNEDLFNKTIESGKIIPTFVSPSA